MDWNAELVINLKILYGIINERVSINRRNGTSVAYQCQSLKF